MIWCVCGTGTRDLARRVTTPGYSGHYPGCSGTVRTAMNMIVCSSTLLVIGCRGRAVTCTNGRWNGLHSTCACALRVILDSAMLLCLKFLNIASSTSCTQTLLSLILRVAHTHSLIAFVIMSVSLCISMRTRACANSLPVLICMCMCAQVTRRPGCKVLPICIQASRISASLHSPTYLHQNKQCTSRHTNIDRCQSYVFLYILVLAHIYSRENNRKTMCVCLCVCKVYA